MEDITPVRGPHIRFSNQVSPVVNGQRLKHYMVGDSVNVDVNIIHTTTHEEHVAAMFQIPTE